VATQLAGSTLCNAWDSLAATDQFEIVSGLGLGLKQLHSWEVKLAETESSNHLDWETFIERQIVVSLERVRGMKQDWKDSLQRFLSMNLSLLPIHYKRVLLHGDLNPGNFLVETEEGQWKIAGLVDFADSLCGFHEYDFITPAIQMAFGNRRLQRALLLSYGYNERELDLHLRCRLMLLTILHESTLLQEAIQRIGPKAHELSLEKLEAEIWSFI
jgi:Ser/Thr protein kinase RdoA (MazF antagonist)